MKKLVIIIIVFMSIVYLHSCQYLYEPTQIIFKSEYLVLEWDSPSVNSMSGFIPVKSYRVYYRKDGSSWVFLGEIPAEEKPRYTVYHSDLGDGLYEFAVRAVYENAQYSSLHISSDQNADPLGGWFLLWIRSK